MDRPLILDISNRSDKAKYNKLIRDGVIIVDQYIEQLQELFKISFPHKKDNLIAQNKYVESHIEDIGNWVYYPWRNQLVHILNKNQYYDLRTARNNPLLPKLIQTKLSKLTVGVVGLSVGSNILRAIIYAGIGRQIRIADPDILMTTNLNRITGNLLDLGLNKTIIIARQIWELDPYIDIISYEEGITGENLIEFMTSPTKLDIIFDEADDIGLKFHLHLAAKSARVAYFMVTDNGYSAELDVDRFDLSSNQGPMGMLPPVTLNDISSSLSISEKIELSPKEEQELINIIIDSTNRVQEMKIAGQMKLSGKIAGWPQLQAVAGIGAGMAVYALKELVEGKLSTGKKVISLN